MEILLFLLLGIGVGTFGSLVGIGGGLICVPFFIFFLSDGGVWPYFHTAASIVGTSLFIVMVNAVSGTVAYLRQGRVYFKAAVPFAIATLPGAFLGSYIADSFTGKQLNFYFGAFLAIVAVIMYWNSTRTKKEDVLTIPEGFAFNRLLGIASSLGVGFLSSIFGIGGGVIHVPLMVYVLDFPVHIATATSNFVLAVCSMTGVVSHVLLDHIVWIPAIAISAGAAIGAQIGARLSRKTKSQVILMLLSISMFALGVKLMMGGN